MPEGSQQSEVSCAEGKSDKPLSPRDCPNTFCCFVSNVKAGERGGQWETQVKKAVQETQEHTEATASHLGVQDSSRACCCSDLSKEMELMPGFASSRWVTFAVLSTVRSSAGVMESDGKGGCSQQHSCSAGRYWTLVMQQTLGQKP